MRSLVPEYSDHIWLTSSEISLSFPSDLPIFLKLNEWLHPDLANNQLPIETETFVPIADALARYTNRSISVKIQSSKSQHWNSDDNS